MSDHYAKEADRLLADDTLTEAFDRVRQEALEALAVAKSDDILRLQAMVAAIDQIRDELRAMVLRKSVADEASPYA
jgi:hypothetical protein